jgi:transcriptional repressor NrdR
MNCPFCGHPDTRVTNSRVTPEGDRIRRRRECEECGQRFTTFESIERGPLFVVKRNGTRQEFNREKLVGGLIRATNKRPISREQLHQIAHQVERAIASRPESEMASKQVGAMVLERLREIDEVAYVRFASVYRDFQNVNEFRRELESFSK